MQNQPDVVEAEMGRILPRDAMLARSGICCCHESFCLAVMSVLYQNIHTYIHTYTYKFYSAKNRENESEALAQDD